MTDPSPPTPSGPARTEPGETAGETAPTVEPVPAPAAPVSTATAAAEPAVEGDGPGGMPPRRRLRNWQLGLLTLLALAFLVGAYLLGRGSDDDDPAANPGNGSAPTSVAPAPPPEGFTTFEDPVTGASLSYPEGWERLSLPTDSEQRLVVTPGGENSVSIRSTQVGFNVTPAELGQAKAQTDQLLADQGLAEVLEQEPLTVNGLSAVYYRYNFTDSDGGEQGLHEHFFIFHGGYLTQLVFQALPTSEYQGLSTTFAQIATTFRAPDPQAQPLPSTSTTAPAADPTTSTTAAVPPSSTP